MAEQGPDSRDPADSAPRPDEEQSFTERYRGTPWGEPAEEPSLRHGALDPIPAAFSRLLAATIPGATFALIPGVSHFAFAEDPEPFFATVRAFLAR